MRTTESSAWALSARVLGLLGLVACGDTSAPSVGDDLTHAPSLELTDIPTRLDASYINTHVYGSFRIGARVEGGPASVIMSGPANFPGHPAAGPGTCDAGTWINANEKRTAGSLQKPHPHCVQAGTMIEVVLEPISACYTVFDMPVQRDCLEPLTVEKDFTKASLVFGKERTTIGLVGASSNQLRDVGSTHATGAAIIGYAIDAATLGTTNRRVGTLTIALSEFESASTNILPISRVWECSMDETIGYPCINRVVTATYDPLPAPDGVGSADTAVEGFLWMAYNKAPYHY